MSAGSPASIKRRGKRTDRARFQPATSRRDLAGAELLALEVIQAARQTEEPADRVLRAALRAAGLTPASARHAARTLFAWYRWRGFITDDDQLPDPAALQRALALAERYAREPQTFSDESLLDQAVPAWWRENWTVTPALVRALQAEPVLWLRSRPGQAGNLAKEFAGAHPGPAAGVPDAVRYDGVADVFRSAAFATGRCEIQDIASQAVGVVCAPQPGETWWDACAGEGGKTLHLCDLMQNRGVVWASDRSAARLDVLRRRAARAKLFNLRIASWNGGPRPPFKTLFDGVLVDAPCSGTGTWQRNPHARWTTGPADVSELAAQQAQLLAAAALAVKPGGRLVYAVCTLTRAETADVVAAFTAAHPAFVPAPFTDPFAPGGGTVSSIAWEPQVTGGNGMFLATWRRVD